VGPGVVGLSFSFSLGWCGGGEYWCFFVVRSLVPVFVFKAETFGVHPSHRVWTASNNCGCRAGGGRRGMGFFLGQYHSITPPGCLIGCRHDSLSILLSVGVWFVESPGGNCFKLILHLSAKIVYIFLPRVFFFFVWLTSKLSLGMCGCVSHVVRWLRVVTGNCLSGGWKVTCFIGRK